ncbi:MAG: signal peptidase II [Fimbriimonadaceae bacterium]
MTRSRIGFVALTLALVGLDQVVKTVSRAAADGVEGRVFLAPWPGVFELKLVYNEGVAFGMFQGAGTFLTPIALIIAGAAAVSALRQPTVARLHTVLCSLLAAGAIGNMIDRLWLGRVTDMFFIRAISFPVFNVADVCITAAAVVLVAGAIFGHHDRGPRAETPPAPEP